ncbi:N-acetylornithine carbamoyltransferase [Marinicauda pacifica]|jgi:N-acetylornithine carbamoyltransferase|uniref:N-acetylornithine carbamoyltransferase n=1 Tax=Marinicauda pacifica TaxID=1133559 RepID=A0A4S2HAE8_9PROT|nr:N-acetylornithine carbamoyltransferase [Marinicauda pacifica]TGY92895.1 N-acetylornithine carbamoyltransferase [Marinicauda pacifica]GGE41174.1 N-acetylornithine carbamoyltransferase [Marinicauda pacifica]
MRHFLSTEDWSRDELQSLIDRARAYRESPLGDALKGKSIALLFFNPSLRTRTSFDLGAYQLGGHAIVLDARGSTWPVEFEEGAVMDDGPEEHVKEAARVLSSYVDLIAIRAFPKFEDWTAEREDPLIQAYARHATVPVINMETIVHPCQELAMMMAMQDRMGDVRGKDFLLTWVPHPKPLNTAVANSAILMASKFGMNVRMLVPDEAFALDPRYMGAAERFCADAGTQFSLTTNVKEAYSGADAVYAKSWGALPFYGKWEEEAPLRAKGAGFMIDDAKMAMTNNAVVSHCLPMRRNVKIADSVVDSDAFLGLQEAENRLHVQKALMESLAGAER